MSWSVIGLYVIVSSIITAIAALLGYVEFDLRDMWVGLFWDRRCSPPPRNPDLLLGVLHVWVILIPCFPIHLMGGFD